MSNLFADFTRDSHRALSNARSVAKKHKQKVMTSTHLLLGLMQLSGSQAEQILRTLRVKPDNIKTRLVAQVRLAAKDDTEVSPNIGSDGRYGKLDFDTTRILEQASAEAMEQDVDFIDSRVLLLGMLRHPQSLAGEMLLQHGVTPAEFRAAAKLHEQGPTNAPRQSTNLSSLQAPVSLSPVFLGLVLFTAISGYLTWAGIGNSGRTVFLFVTGGWLISLALHEFGHALVGYWGGDKSVVDKGYLTLNPLKYTHPLLSIALPLIFLIIGGIGLPGGAVYINRLAIRRQFMHSLISAAGPIATFLFGVITAIPFIFNLHRSTLETHSAFWEGLAFLLFVQIIALLLNLLPIPGLDGFGIIEPFLPPSILRVAETIRGFSLILIFLVLFRVDAIASQFFDSVWQLAILINFDLVALVPEGFDLFRFWTSL